MIRNIRTIIHKFDFCALNYGDLSALYDGEERIDYTDLRIKALNFAQWLIDKNLYVLDTEPRVILNLEKSNNYIIALLGCMYAKHCFIPLTPDLPDARKKNIIEDVKPHIIIDRMNFPKNLENNCITSKSKKMLSSIKHDQLAYIIYTSGSTGKPKGVMLEHKGLPNVIEQQTEIFDIKPEDNLFLLLSINFDASLSDIFCALTSGACLHISTKNKIESAAQLPDLLKKRKITHIDLAPSLLTVLSPESMPACLKTIIIGGEVCPVWAVKKWSSRFNLVNVYGPTEATICTSTILCDANWNSPLIGKPLEGVDYTLIDQELLISGIQIARGYWNNVKLTSEKFVQHEEKRFYKTGDKIELDEDGQYVFRGRMDRQIKIRGQLVELSEVEQTILEFSFVKRVYLMPVIENGIAKEVHCYYEGQKDLVANDLLKALPNFMIPSTFIKLDQMPLTPSGKVDKNGLKEILNNKSANKTGIIQLPKTALQNKIWQIWSDILNKKSFGITCRFADLGADSMNIVDFCLRAEREQIKLSPSVMAVNPTIEQIEQHLLKAKVIPSSLKISALNNDLKLPGDILEKISHRQQNPVACKETNTIFMTGATGGLGSKILSDLISRTNKKIICLVRSKHEKDAENRIINAIKNHIQISSQIILSRITCVNGDLTQEQFGIHSQKWREICSATDEIIHCAAEVNIVKSYQQLKASNLLPCFTLMRLALESNARKLHNISTLSVFVATDQNKGTVFEHDKLSNIGRVYGGYAQTKAASEILFHGNDNFNKICPVTSYRLGLITGDQGSGKMSNSDFLGNFIKGLLSLGCYPKTDSCRELSLDVTPIDFASKTLCDLITSKADTDDCYHLANIKGFSFEQIIRLLKEANYKLDAVSLEQWLGLKEERTLNHEERMAYFGLCRLLPKGDFEKYRSLDLFQATNIEFDMTRLKMIFPELAIPKASDELFRKYVSYITKDLIAL